MALFTKYFKLTILVLINILAFEKKLKFRLSQIANSLNSFYSSLYISSSVKITKHAEKLKCKTQSQNSCFQPQ